MTNLIEETKEYGKWEAWAIYDDYSDHPSTNDQYGNPILEVSFGDDWDEIPSKEEIIIFAKEESKRAGYDLINGLTKVVFIRKIKVTTFDEDGEMDCYTDDEEDYISLHIGRYEYPEFLEEAE